MRSLITDATMLACFLSAVAYGRDARDLRLVPFPKETELTQGVLPVGGQWVLHAGSAISGELSVALDGELRRAGSEGLRDRAWGPDNGFALALAGRTPPTPPEPPAEHGPEAYALTIGPDGVAATGAGRAGARHALQTLRQLIRTEGAQGVPCLEIRDWPALTWRAFQDDLTRGPSSNRDYLLRQLELGSYLKLNVWTYYMEHQYEFASHPELAPEGGALTPADLSAMVDHGRRYGVEILGNQQSFGHMEDILIHEEHADLAEVPSVLTPMHEGTYALLDDLYGDVIPRLPFGLFNVCCDETWGLGEGPSKPLAEEIGVGGVYVRHINRLHDLVTGKYGKRMMMWGDIILNHPDRLDDLPEDVVVLTWGYHAADSFEEQILPFVESGFDFWVCPGVSNWSRVMPDFATAQTNIANFIADGVRHGAEGTIITAWDDDGLTLDPTCWQGFAWGAECAWTGSTTPPEDFARRIGSVLFGETEARFGSAIERLSRLPVRFSGDFFAPPPSSRQVVDTALAHRGLRGAMARQREIEAAVRDLKLCRASATVNADLVDFFIHGAQRLWLIEEREVRWLDAALSSREGRHKEARGTLQGVRDGYAASLEEFRGLWRRINRPYALEWSVDAYERVLAAHDEVLAGLDAAIGASDSGQPAAAVGLTLVERPSPRAKAAGVGEAVGPNTPWAVAGCGRRALLTLHGVPASGVPRPIEADVELPALEPGVPLVAMVDTADGARPVPAQAGRAGRSGQTRVCVVLPADVDLPAGPVRCWLYWDGAEVGPGGVRGYTDDQGNVWLENDEVRLAVGSEGGLIYQWEVNGAQPVDLTLEGASGFSGFADINTQRGVPHSLLLAEAGPAMARVYCQAPDGLVKTITLYAGAAWAEVMLDRSVTYFWCFDPPRGESGDRYVFSTGASGEVPPVTGTVESQVVAHGATWALKEYASGLALGMATPGLPTRLTIGPGGGMGGVGIEGGGGAQHFVIYGGRGDGARAVLGRLSQDLDLKLPIEVRVSTELDR